MSDSARSALALALGLCLATPTIAWAGQDPEALQAQQMEYAKQQFGEGEGLFQKGDFRGAVKKYELAYQYAPDFHVLNFNIGLAWKEAGECQKAKTSFQRFLDLVQDHPARGDAQQALLDLEREGCAAAPPVPGTTTPEEEEAPILSGDAPAAEDPLAGDPQTEGPAPVAKPKKFNGLMLAGIGMAGVGVVLVVTGAVTGIITRSSANQLDEKAQPGFTGFSPNSFADDDVFKLDVRRKRLGVTTAILLPAGGALLVAGVALFVLGKKKCKDKKNKAKTARLRRLQLTGFGPALLRGGGGVGASFAFSGQAADPAPAADPAATPVDPGC